MHHQETTLARLLDERARQDEEFRSLCATLASFDPGQRFQLSETRARELGEAWAFRPAPRSRVDNRYSLRA